jgi:serine phosphatase RsbU (regulator of sigma subunit)
MMAITEGIPAVSQITTRERPAMPTLHALREELDRERREHGALQQAVFEAAQIQRQLCAPREFARGEYELAGEIFPVRHLSGDFFKVIELDQVLGIAVGDIAGKGLTAGIWLAHLLSLVHRSARAFMDPGRTVAEVNRELCREHGEPPLTALFFAILDPRTHELRYSNAGLPPPLLVHANRRIQYLDDGGPMLGAIENAVFDSGVLRMNPGDMLVAYSDGVTECRDPKDQEFETHRLGAAALAAHGTSANPALFSMLGTVLDFADSSTPGDDLTFLVVRRQAGNSAEPLTSERNFPAPQGRAAATVRWKRANPRRRSSK